MNYGISNPKEVRHKHARTYGCVLCEEVLHEQAVAEVGGQPGPMDMPALAPAIERRVRIRLRKKELLEPGPNVQDKSSRLGRHSRGRVARYGLGLWWWGHERGYVDDDAESLRCRRTQESSSTRDGGCRVSWSSTIVELLGTQQHRPHYGARRHSCCRHHVGKHAGCVSVPQEAASRGELAAWSPVG